MSPRWLPPPCGIRWPTINRRGVMADRLAPGRRRISARRSAWLIVRLPVGSRHLGDHGWRANACWSTVALCWVTGAARRLGLLARSLGCHLGQVDLHLALEECFYPRGERRIAFQVRLEAAIGTAPLEVLPAFTLERLADAAVVSPTVAEFEELLRGGANGHRQAEPKGNPRHIRRGNQLHIGSVGRAEAETEQRRDENAERSSPCARSDASGWPVRPRPPSRPADRASV